MNIGRIVREVELGGRRLVALFDTGSERSYIRKSSMPKPVCCEKIRPFSVGIGGKKHTVGEVCVVVPRIENMEFDVMSHPLDEIGQVDGKEIDIVVGALEMERWHIRLDPDRKELDLTGLKKREFTEF